MEVNLENAFLVATKISMNPVISTLDIAAGTVLKFLQRQAINALEKPLVSTLVFSCIIVTLICVITISIIITTGVLCVVVVLLLFQGYILATILALTAAITAFCLAAGLIIAGTILVLKKND